MIRVTILYPNKRGSHFDHVYYRDVHLPLAIEKMGPYGLIRAEVDRVLTGVKGVVPDYHCVGHLYLDSAESFYKGMAAVGDEIKEDVPAYTDVRGTVVVAEIFGGVGEISEKTLYE